MRRSSTVAAPIWIFWLGQSRVGSVTGLAIDEGAVAAAEVFDQDMIEIDRELRVPPRDQFNLDLHLALRFAPDDVIAGPDGLAQDFRAVFGDDDLGLGNNHGEPRDKVRPVPDL